MFLFVFIDLRFYFLSWFRAFYWTVLVFITFQLMFFDFLTFDVLQLILIDSCGLLWFWCCFLRRLLILFIFTTILMMFAWFPYSWVISFDVHMYIYIYIHTLVPSIPWTSFECLWFGCDFFDLLTMSFESCYTLYFHLLFSVVDCRAVLVHIIHNVSL